LPFAIELIEKYREHPICLNTGKLFPVISNQKMNTYLKEIADICGIEKKLQLGTAQNDLTKICKLIAFLTGNSYNSIYNELQKGIFFSKTHSRHIDEKNIFLKMKMKMLIVMSNYFCNFAV
jgi:hypothetical protein